MVANFEIIFVLVIRSDLYKVLLLRFPTLMKSECLGRNVRFVFLIQFFLSVFYTKRFFKIGFVPCVSEVTCSSFIEVREPFTVVFICPPQN